jgi:hypothetical protein
MGFFGKIKQNLNHGGVDVSLSVPDRIEKGQTSLHAQVTISATEARTIKSVRVQIERRYDNSGNSQRQNSVLGSAVYETPFAITPGQPLSLQFDISLKPEDEMADDHPVLASLASGITKLNDVYDKGSMVSYWHYVNAIVDVENINFDPHADQRIQIDGQEKPFLRIT